MAKERVRGMCKGARDKIPRPFWVQKKKCPRGSDLWALSLPTEPFNFKCPLCTHHATALALHTPTLHLGRETGVTRHFGILHTTSIRSTQINAHVVIWVRVLSKIRWKIVAAPSRSNVRFGSHGTAPSFSLRLFYWCTKEQKQTMAWGGSRWGCLSLSHSLSLSVRMCATVDVWMGVWVCVRKLFFIPFASFIVHVCLATVCSRRMQSRKECVACLLILIFIAYFLVYFVLAWVFIKLFTHCIFLCDLKVCFMWSCTNLLYKRTVYAVYCLLKCK